MNNKVKVIPISGLGEVGRNMTAIEYEDRIYVVDAGIAFPDQDLYGVDSIIPNFDYLTKNKEKIQAIFITHAHEDHIGAVPNFVQAFPGIPVYGTELTLGMIKNKEKYHQMGNVNYQKIIPETTVLQIGNMKVHFFRTIHSIYDSVGIVFETPIGCIVHTGDYKIDFTPVNNKPMDMERILELRKKGVLLLISDSTNAEKEGMSVGESVVADYLESEISKSKGMIVVSSFASSLARVQSILTIAEKLNKKVIVLGKSMEKNIALSLRLNEITCGENVIIEPKKIKEYDRENILVIATGAQGEGMAALNRLANDDIEEVSLQPNDTVIFSSGTVPGNEKQVSNLINKLYKRELNVIQDKKLHTSGHGHRDEIKLMLSLLKPTYLLPSHGEYRMLVNQKKIGVSVGIKKEHIFICENGDVLEVGEDSAKIIDTVKADPVYIDGSGVNVVNINSIRDRKRMAEQGLIVIQVKHFIKTKETKVKFELKGITSKIAKAKLNKELVKGFESEYESGNLKEGKQIERELVSLFSNIIYKQIKSRPLIIPMVDFIK